jgi:hypothetical protein
MKLNYSKRKITNFDNTFRDTHSLSNFILMLIVELVWKRFLIPRKNSMRQNRFLPPSDVCHIFCPFSAFTFYVQFWSDFCSPSLTKRHNKFYVAVKPRIQNCKDLSRFFVRKLQIRFYTFRHCNISQKNSFQHK